MGRARVQVLTGTCIKSGPVLFQVPAGKHLPPVLEHGS
jgi:hypothetical protein